MEKTSSTLIHEELQRRHPVKDNSSVIRLRGKKEIANFIRVCYDAQKLVGDSRDRYAIV